MAGACQPGVFLEAETSLTLPGDRGGTAQDAQHGHSPGVTADSPIITLY